MIKPHKADEIFKQTKWIVLGATGFESESAARQFGVQLRQIVEVAAFSSRLGVDVGLDRPTTWVNEEWARGLGLVQPHQRLMPNVHGLMVMPDDDLTKIPAVTAQGAVTADPAQLVTSINELGRKLPVRIPTAASGVRILNLALMNAEPLAQVVLALSAIEALGQEETWTDGQRALLNGLAAQVDRDAESNAEFREVSEALRRSVHRIGLRQGVRRVLSRLELEHLQREWDDIYGLRSGVFHGTAPQPEAKIHELARDAITLAGRVLLAVMKDEGLEAPSIADTHFNN